MESRARERSNSTTTTRRTLHVVVGLVAKISNSPASSSSFPPHTKIFNTHTDHNIYILTSCFFFFIFSWKKNFAIFFFYYYYLRAICAAERLPFKGESAEDSSNNVRRRVRLLCFSFFFFWEKEKRIIYNCVICRLVCVWRIASSTLWVKVRVDSTGWLTSHSPPHTSQFSSSLILSFFLFVCVFDEKTKSTLTLWSY